MTLEQEWMTKAEHDLLPAKKLFEVGLHDTAMFHTQQCAEKSLKGFLAFHSKPIQKIHNLVVLNEQCKQIELSFVKLQAAVLFLNNRDTGFRYPSEEMDPTHEEITQAIEFAENVFLFVKTLIKT
jgi:HEPN domain-containing protein